MAGEALSGAFFAAADLGPAFPQGLFACQDNDNTAPAAGNQNFKYVPLERVVPLPEEPAGPPPTTARPPRSRLVTSGGGVVPVGDGPLRRDPSPTGGYPLDGRSFLPDVDGRSCSSSSTRATGTYSTGVAQFDAFGQRVGSKGDRVVARAGERDQPGAVGTAGGPSDPLTPALGHDEDASDRLAFEAVSSRHRLAAGVLTIRRSVLTGGRFVLGPGGDGPHHAHQARKKKGTPPARPGSEEDRRKPSQSG